MDTLRDPSTRRVLLAVDQRSTATGSVDEAIRLARADDAELIVLSVVERASLRLPGGLTRRVDQERDRLAAGARSIVERAREAGIAATYLVWEGDPAETIVEASSCRGRRRHRPRFAAARLTCGRSSSAACPAR